MVLAPISREDNPNFGPHFVMHVAGESFGFADYYSSPAPNAPDQRFTMAFVGPAGSFKMPVPAAMCLLAIFTLPLLLLGVGFWARRRRLHPQ